MENGWTEAIREKDGRIAMLTKQLRKEGEEMLFWRHQHRDAEKQIAKLERERAETFIAAPMSESQHLIDRKQLLEQIAKLERDNKVMAALNDGFPPEIIRLDEQIAIMDEHLRIWKQKLNDADERITTLNDLLKKRDRDMQATIDSLENIHRGQIAALRDALGGLCSAINAVRKDIGTKYPALAEAWVLAQAAIGKGEGK